MAEYEITLTRTIKESARVYLELPPPSFDAMTSEELWEAAFSQGEARYADWDVVNEVEHEVESAELLSEDDEDTQFEDERVYVAGDLLPSTGLLSYVERGNMGECG